MLLPGSYISKGSVVGARALVTKAFMNNNVVIAGIPAKL
jgi:acetyltransferase-like isoleucine patch superfamily enzyme